MTASPPSLKSPPAGAEPQVNPSPNVADRGRLTISERAIEKIAGQIAVETPGVSGVTGGLLGIGTRDTGGTRPKVKVQLHGLTAFLHVRAGIGYPAPLRATTERLRERICTQVSARCGVDVRQVDIEVDALVSDTTTNGRRELL
jgi:uncharacterized alkaline shock family protein YloU